MQTYVNEKAIKRKATTGRMLVYLGLALSIGAAALLIFRVSNMFFPALIAVLVGTLLSQLGSMYFSRYGRSPRLDEVLLTGLKGLSDDYAIFQHYLKAENTVIAPAGIFALSPQLEAGEIEYKDSAWYQTSEKRFPIHRRVRKKIKNVDSEAEAGASRLTRQMQEIFPSKKLDIQPLIVFLHQNAEVSTEGTVIPAARLSKLKSTLRKAPKCHSLTTMEIHQLAEKIDAIEQNQ